MALTSSNVRVAVTGAVSVAPTGTTAPTDAVTALAVGFTDLGYISEDGVTETRDRSTTKIKAWQNAATVRDVVTDANLAYAFTLIETSEASLELYYGATVAADGSVAIDPGSSGGRKSFAIDVVDGDQFIRTYIAEGEVSTVGEQVYANGEPVGYPVTITAYPVDGVAATKFYSALDTTP